MRLFKVLVFAGVLIALSVPASAQWLNGRSFRSSWTGRRCQQRAVGI